MLDTVATGGLAAWPLTCLVATIFAGGALYGAAIGAWRGSTMVLYAAIKLPCALLITVVLTLSINGMVARFLGLRIGFRQTLSVTVLAMACSTWLLAALAPVAWMFSVVSPPPGSDARTTHNVLYLLHVALVGWAGLVGARVLDRALGRFGRCVRRRRRVFAAWLLVYGLVGGQVTWALRPFVGSIYQPVELLRVDALRGNVYEFIVTDVAPHLWATVTKPSEESYVEPSREPRP